jgi:hypothetical protein
MDQILSDNPAGKYLVKFCAEWGHKVWVLVVKFRGQFESGVYLTRSWVNGTQLNATIEAFLNSDRHFDRLAS